MQTLTTLSVVLWILAAVSVVLACVGARRLFWKVDAKFLRNPEANEPSDAGYGARQVGLVISAVMCVILAIFVTSMRNEQKITSQNDLYSVVSSAATELDGVSDLTFGVYSGQVEAAVENAGGEGQVTVTDVGEGEDEADKYEITTNDGRFAVCLGVTSDWDMYEPDAPTYVSTTVDDGPC